MTQLGGIVSQEGDKLYQAAVGHLACLKRIEDDPLYVARAVGYEECLNDWKAARTHNAEVIKGLVEAATELYNLKVYKKMFGEDEEYQARKEPAWVALGVALRRAEEAL